jgi:redox-sensitive bicupin YhaK (pirin superfamily)
MEVITPRPSDLGDGFIVHRALPSAARRAVGPFVFLDEFGPVTLPPGQGMDVRPHPHIGLATVTYLFEGEIVHRDSLGTVETIRPGEVNWMTAGRGIVHSERSPQAVRAAGARLWGLQFWVALPLALENGAPAFAHHDAQSLPRGERGGARWSVVLGEAFGQRSPVAVTSPMFLVDVRLAAGARIEFDTACEERAAYVAEGEVRAVGAAGEAGPVGREQLLAFAPGEPLVLEAVGGPAHVMLLGGPPLDAPRFLWWNFVSSSRDAILDAQAAWSDQPNDPFGQVPGETEHIPLPSRPAPPAPTAL